MSADGTLTEAVLYWWNKALESLKAACRELAAQGYTFAINHAYYALFYAVSALLLEEGRRFSTVASGRPSIETSSGLDASVESTVSCITSSSGIGKRAITLNSPPLTPLTCKKKLMPVRNS